jgi:Glycosyl transferase family 2
MDVDLLFLSRDLSPPRDDVRRGIEAQEGVRLRVHRVVGTPRPEDPNRWETIARARNGGKRLGTSPWVMCLDDDVVLAPGCIAGLLEALRARPGFAALAADSAGEMAGGWQDWDYPRHVGMAAVLFRRDRLAAIRFRWEPGRCECQCCCDDLRRDGHGIGYLPAARAWHRPAPARSGPPTGCVVDGPRDSHTAAARPSAIERPPRILSAFDRGHYDRFRRQFLASLRAWGNREAVTAVTYGLHPGERARLEAAGVEVVACRDPGIGPALQRIRDFPRVLERWPEDTPVAYWDAADVLFQGRLAPLWDLVRAHPGKILAAREPVEIGASPALEPWTATIRDPAERRRVFDLFSTYPFVNSGFGAGTAGAFLDCFRIANRLIDTTLDGIGPWGDQVAMNCYLHTNPGVWQEVPDAWNYCLCCREPGTYRIRPDGRVESRDGHPVHVVHGNGRTLGTTALSYIG